MYVERNDGAFKLRRGFSVEPGQKVVMVEDIVTTGLSSRECIAAIQEAGGEVVAAACIVDRSGGRADVGVPLIALATLDVPAYPADALPPELAPYFSEKFLHLNSCFIPADRSRYAGIPALSRQSQGLPEDAVVFGAFNNSYKITRAMTDIWFDILNEVPASVLWLVDDNPEATASLRRYAAARGLAPERLVFSPRVATEPYLGRLRMMDLFLDCFPYNAGSTARDVLQMSTPLLTLSGRSFVSRMAGSLLRQLGLDELVTDSAAAYKASAVAWGLDAAARAALRGRVAQAVAAAPAAEQFTRALEAALQRAHSGQVPSLFAGDLDELARVTAGAAGRTGLAAGQGVGPGAAQPSPSLFNVSYQAAAGATRQSRPVVRSF
jgi:hypothetical protein